MRGEEGKRGGRGKLETKLWKIGELNYDVSWIAVYFIVFVIIKGGEGRYCSKISEELRNVVVTEWRMIGVDGN